MRISRRALLARTTAGALAAAPLLPALAMRAPQAAREGDASRIAFVNLHTGERADVVVAEGGELVRDALAEIDHVLRDHRSGDVHPIDTALVEQLIALRALLGTRQPYHVISGYRSPATNAMLAEASGGVARNSMHVLGRAIDIRVPGIDLREVQRAALAMGAGGVGYYARSQFVHLDTGRVRRW
jgi:uncharacterized protein YcbK (DUF882 family)